MNLVTAPSPELLAALDEDGATYDLGDGSFLRVTIQPDEWHTLTDDGDWLGSLEPVRRGWEHDAERPDGFDGRARKFYFDRSCDGWWWQPPADVTDPDAVSNLARTVERLGQEGYEMVTVELRERLTDSAGRAHVVTVRSATIGGVDFGEWNDPNRGAYLADIIGDLVVEVLG